MYSFHFRITHEEQGVTHQVLRAVLLHHSCTYTLHTQHGHIDSDNSHDNDHHIQCGGGGGENNDDLLYYHIHY